jgi:AraC-like DNA-binding protein
MAKPPAADAATAIPVSAVYARALLRRFGRTPEDRRAMLDAAGVSAAAIEGPNVDIPLSSLIRIAGNLARKEGEDWPLDAAQIWSSAMQGALDVAARSSATVGGALEVFFKYGSVRAPFLKIRKAETRDAIRLVFSKALETDDVVWRALAQSAALGVSAMLTQILEERTAETAISFPWPAPRRAEQLRSMMECGIQFGAVEFALVAPKSLLDVPSPFADGALRAAAIEELEAAARRIAAEDRLVLDLERLIAARLPARLSEEEAALHLGLSRRSLVRRLAASGRPFRKVLDDEMRARASAMIAAGGRSRADMAAALGYADPTSFSRACRRWFKDQ